MRLSVVLMTFLMLTAVTNASAQTQLFDNPRVPTISPVPESFVGTWHWTTPRQSCGSSVDSYGNPVTFDVTENGRPVCQWPIDQLEKVLNGRGRAWVNFVKGDDAISPRWTCVAAGLGIVLTEGYLREFYKNPDALVMHMEQSNWFRYIWMDGRKHPPATEAYYHGHSVGWMEGNVLVVETTNLTWDPDGYDDHSHIARSHMAKVTERYRQKDKDNLELSITVEDPLFLTKPFTFVGNLQRTDQKMINTWDCDPAVAAKELYDTLKNRYPDDKAAEQYFKDK
jgi:hypothetical protein